MRYYQNGKDIPDQPFEAFPEQHGFNVVKIAQGVLKIHPKRSHAMDEHYKIVDEKNTGTNQAHYFTRLGLLLHKEADGKQQHIDTYYNK